MSTVIRTVQAQYKHIAAILCRLFPYPLNLYDSVDMQLGRLVIDFSLSCVYFTFLLIAYFYQMILSKRISIISHLF
jgi:hypothetical protein